MTVPATVPELAGWDLPRLRAGVGRLTLVADRLLPWRARLDALGRELGTAECWSGPAGTVAAAAVVELSTVASRVSGALGSSLTSLQDLTAAAAEAEEWAAGAVAAAGTAGVTLDAAGRPVGVPAPPAPAMAADQVADVLAARQAAQVAAARAEEALLASSRALACARDAQQPLAGLGLPGGAGAADFADLVARLPPPRSRPVPASADPRAAARWWAGLTAGEQLIEIATRPAAVGALDGLPAWARDRANRLQLAAALHDLSPGPQRVMAGVVAAQLAAQGDAGPAVQLLRFDPAADLVAISLGDLDTAGAVAVLVPGMETTPGDDLPGLLGDAREVAAAARDSAPGLAVAAVAWLGYRTPRFWAAPLPGAARRGGPSLDRALDGLAAARSAAGAAPGPRTTVVAHSYGTVVAGQAARAPGRLAADALVLLGSPGLAGGEAEDLEAGEVYGAWSPGDPVSWVQWFGDNPADLSFGDVPLPAELTEGHTDYFDPDRPTLAAIGGVVAGTQGGGEGG